MNLFWIRVSILFHILSHGVVEPRIRQASPVVSDGSSTPLPVELPKVVRKRRKFNLEFIQVQSDDGGGDGTRFGIMNEEDEKKKLPPSQHHHPKKLNLEGLNQVVQRNQIQFMAEAPKLNVLMKDRHEKPSILEQLNERNKKIQIQEMESPEALFRAFSMSMQSGEDSDALLRSFSMSMQDADAEGMMRSFSMSMSPEEREMDLTYNMVQKQFSMSMSMSIRTRSGETDPNFVWTEDRDFFLRSGGNSMMMMSLSMESRTAKNPASQESGRIPLRPRSIHFFQMQDMSMVPTAPFMPTASSAPTVPSPPSAPTTGSPESLPPATTISPSGSPGSLPPGTTMSPSASSGSLPPGTSPTLAPDASISGGRPTAAPVPTISPGPTQAPVPTTSPAPSSPIMPDRTLAPTDEGTDELSSAAMKQGVPAIIVVVGFVVVWMGWEL